MKELRKIDGVDDKSKRRLGKILAQSSAGAPSRMNYSEKYYPINIQFNRQARLVCLAIISQDRIAGFAGANALRAGDWKHKNLAVALFSGARIFQDDLNRQIDIFVAHHHLQLQLG